VRGLDTNVIVRFLVRDDPEQATLATRFIRAQCTAETPCRINRIVLCELEWVLESAYRYSRSTVADVIAKVLRTVEFEIEDRDAAWAALFGYRNESVDFADCLLGKTNRAAGCDATATFDQKAARTDDFVLVAKAMY
jgi:predicted nucleic-acid-binding protein